MANVYLGAELLTGGGGGSSSTQADALDLVSLGIWNGDYTNYNAITTKDANTIYFVSGDQSAFALASFTIAQSATTKNTVATPTELINFTTTLVGSEVVDQQGAPIAGVTYKWWVTGGATSSDFAMSGGSANSNIGTSQATATAVSDDSITHNSTTDGTFTVNVAVFNPDGTQLGASQAFTPVTASGTVTISISSSYSGASFYWQCGGPTVSAVLAYNQSIRVGGEVDPDQSVSQSYSRSGDAHVVSEVCYNYSDGFGYRVYARLTNSTVTCYFSA